MATVCRDHGPNALQMLDGWEAPPTPACVRACSVLQATIKVFKTRMHNLCDTHTHTHCPSQVSARDNVAEVKGQDGPTP